MANEIHGEQAFNAVAAVEIDFGYLVSSFAIWAKAEFHIGFDEDATVGHHLLPANTYISYSIPARKISIFGGGGVSGTVYWIATPMLTIENDLSIQNNRGGIHV
jgi:hypothetical protein